MSTQEPKISMRTTDAECGDEARGKQLLLAYLENELSPARRQDFEDHLHACEYCAACVENWPKVVAAIRESPHPSVRVPPEG